MSSDSSARHPLSRLLRRGVRNVADVGPMDPRRTKLFGISAIILGLTAFALITGLVFSGSSLASDGADHRWFVNNRSALATAIFTGITDVSAPNLLPFVVILAAVLWAWWSKQLWRPLLLAGSMAATVGLTVVLKSLITHNRPPAAEMLLGPDDDHSFPSGHTLVATIFLLVLAYLILSRRPRRLRTTVGGVLAAVGILAVATSRLYLGYHWLTDVSASFALALAILGAVVLIDLTRRPQLRSQTA